MSFANIIVIGAGGHAKVCIEVLRSLKQKVDYCITSKCVVNNCLNVPVLFGDEQLIKLYESGYSKVFIAIGDNQLRRHLVNIVKEVGFELINAVSPQAIVSPTVKLGKGIVIMPGAVINAETIIDDVSIINTGAVIDHDCYIGEASHIAPQCGLAGNVRIGKGSFLGIGCKVIPNVVIGDNVIVGAGGVVIANIPDQVTAVGVPAKVIKS